MKEVLRNLLLFPPCEGSKDRHQAWKQSVRILLYSEESHIASISDGFWDELMTPDWISIKGVQEAVRLGKLIN